MSEQESKKYQATLDYLYTQLPMFQRVGSAAYNKYLTNIRLLCKALDNPEQSFKCVHIAGTNGKGSVSNMLAAVFQDWGYITGLYTSPHYKDFRERIRVNGQMIPTETVIGFVENNKSLFEKIKPSFFEITVAMAFDYFAKAGIEIGIIETGLGGRLDSTNIVMPELSIITNIGYDHQQFLGETLPEIALEKAGIIKPGIPVVIGETQEETVPVFNKIAIERNAPISFADAEMDVQVIGSSVERDFYKIENNLEIQVDLKGSYQSKNLTTVLKSLGILEAKFPDKNSRSVALKFEALGKVKKLTGYQGRWQTLGNQPTILCDSAHNEQGLEIVLKDLLDMDYENLHIVLGVVNDKKIGKILSMFPKNAQYYFAKANISRGLDAEILRQQGMEFALLGKSYDSVGIALEAAKGFASEDDLIFVGGSTFVVAEVI